MLIIFTPCQISDIINGFWVITQKPSILPYVVFFSNSGHVGWCTASPDTILKLDTLVMIQTKFGFNWSGSFRGEDFWKSLRRTTERDGRQVMEKAHMAFFFIQRRMSTKYIYYIDDGWFIVFNATFNNISVIYHGSQFYWWSTWENHRPVVSHWQTLSRNVVHLVLIKIQTHNISGDRHWLHM